MRFYLLLTVFTGLLFLPGINNLPVVERDEAHFVQASRQMLQTGNYFQVRFQDITRFQKPPGINWLQAAAVSLFSHPDNHDIWPYRLPSVLSAWLAVLATYFFSRRAWGHHIALLAAALLASSLLLVVVTHMAVIDGPLLLTVVLMQGGLWVIFNAGMRKQRPALGWVVLFWLSTTAGCVLKGVTPLVALLTVLGLWVMTQRKDWIKGLRIWQGSLLCLVLTLAWLLPMNVAEHSNYLLEMLHRDLLPKLQGGHESHGKPPLFHLALLPLTFWPGSLFLAQTVRHAWRKRQNHDVQFALAWLIPTWIFFEIMPTKLPHYVLSTFPALAMLVALALKSTTRPMRWEHVLQALWGLMSTGLALAVVVLPYQIMGAITVWSATAGVIMFSLSMAGVYWAWLGNYHRCAVTLFLNAALVFPLIFALVLPSLKPLWIAETVGKLMEGHDISPTKPLFATGFVEPGLVFYLNTHHVEFYPDQASAIAQCMQRSGYLLADASIVTLSQSSLQLIGSIDGYNYSKGRWVKLWLMGC